LKSEADVGKKNKGAVYTPDRIVELILNCIGYTKNSRNILNKKIVDPACGEGAFLCMAAKILITKARKSGKTDKEIKKLLQQNIYGFDIDSQAINCCCKCLDQTTKALGIDPQGIDWHIIQIDSLDKKVVNKFFDQFDFVVGNPPYIRVQNIKLTRRKNLYTDWKLCKESSTDIFIAFFELGYYLLNSTGKLGYITPNTYLKTRAGKLLRNFLKESRAVKTLIDFRHYQIFEDVKTYSLITILDKSVKHNCFCLYHGNSESIDFVDEVDIEHLNLKNWVLASTKILKRLQNIENRGVPLKNLAKIHVGITTLADELFVFKNPTISVDKKSFLIKLKDNSEFFIEKDMMKPIVKVSLLKNSAENQNRYIIFPYKCFDGKHVIMPEDEIKMNYPLAYKFLLAVKPQLLNRDRGKPNPLAWYAFGRTQGLDTSFGKKILTASIGLKPRFIVWTKEDHTFYGGYCIKYDGNLDWLARKLNSADMEFYIKHISRDFQGKYKSFAKAFIENFGITPPKHTRFLD
jgi:adenine-specific DNA-methyltransferase